MDNFEHMASAAHTLCDAILSVDEDEDEQLSAKVGQDVMDLLANSLRASDGGCDPVVGMRILCMCMIVILHSSMHKKSIPAASLGIGLALQKMSIDALKLFPDPEAN